MKILLKVFMIVSIVVTFLSNVTYAESGISTRSIIGDDTRKKVVSNTSSPYKSIVLLIIEYKDYEDLGTGVMINNDTVLTAGHNIYNKYKGGYAKKIRVYGGATNITRNTSGEYVVTNSLGRSNAINTYVPKEFTSSELTSEQKDNYDYGVIRLSSALGKETGFLATTPLVSTKEEITIAGYPEDKNGLMYSSVGNISSVNENIVYYNNDSKDGDSGSPILNKYNQIIGIHTNGFDTQSIKKLNSGIKLTTDIINQINTWKNTPIFQPYVHDVVILKPDYNIYTDITLSNIITKTNGRIDEVYKSTKIYNLINGYKYIDLCDSTKCYGLVNKNATVVLQETDYVHRMKLLPDKSVFSQDIYHTYNPDNISNIELTKSYYNKEVMVKHAYYKDGELLCYDVYDINGKFLGYIESIALELIN